LLIEAVATAHTPFGAYTMSVYTDVEVAEYEAESVGDATMAWIQALPTVLTALAQLGPQRGEYRSCVWPITAPLVALMGLVETV
jgi:hypothetical protein